MSRRKIDMQVESELAHFLDEYFYSRLVASGELSSAERIYDAEMQQKGVDVLAKKSSACAYIDEKAQLYYINKALPTFAFELSFLLEDEVQTGWLLNNTLLTNRFFLLWPHALTTDFKELSYDQFTVVYGLMLKKSSLLHYLESLGLSNQQLSNTAKDLREKRVAGRAPSGVKGIYYYASDPDKYTEAPINLVIGKSILEQYASAYYEIRPEALQRLK